MIKNKYGLTWKDRKILRWFQEEAIGAYGPTAIGLANGQPYDTASSWTTRTIKKFINWGLLDRVGEGNPQYSLSKEGRKRKYLTIIVR